MRTARTRDSGRIEIGVFEETGATRLEWLKQNAWNRE